MTTSYDSQPKGKGIDVDTVRIKKYYLSVVVLLEGEFMAPHFSEPLFVISVAARLVEMHPQTLRKYEREGLIAPSRTTGNLRLYSDSDIEQLRQVKYLVEERGLNLAGVQLALELTRQLQSLKQGATTSPPELSDEHLASAFDDVLRKLGFVEQAQVRSQRRHQT
ncbi:MAG TPA: MerR family transcriptional regulator [Thermomicrobiales bacterium]|nr:MerR family transcriptional regulator [Thermomicrobiales bacterium]